MEWIVYVFLAGLLTVPIVREMSQRIRFYYEEKENERKEKQYYAYSSPVLLNVLERIPYYMALSAEGRTKFKGRVIEFLIGKEFTGVQDLVVTEDMKLQISATAVQLTFGLKNYFISYFHNIVIYPSTFYSRLARHQLKGGTTENGIIQLSWADYTAGNTGPAKTINLGLHEMAHALEIGVLKGNDFDKKFANYYDFWKEEAEPLFIRMHAGEKSFLRAYAGTNEHEFFAVCVEFFFGDPVGFKNRLPVIYHHLCILLNQDPSRIHNDYEQEYDLLTTDARNRTKISYKYDSWHWSLTVLLAGIFAGPLLLLYESMQITDPEYNIGLLYFSIVAAGAYPQYRYLVKTQVLNGFQFAGYLFIGFGLLATAFLLFLNSLGGFSSPHSHNYTMNGDMQFVGNEIRVYVDDAKQPSSGNADCVPASEFEKIKRGNILQITFKKGIVGAETFKSNRIIERISN
ncbi:MAG: zinc-dependent peptidase [Bacteroidia bacterium]